MRKNIILFTHFQRGYTNQAYHEVIYDAPFTFFKHEIVSIYITYPYA